MTNRLLRIAADLSVSVVLEDYSPEHLEAVMNALAAGALTRDLIYHNIGRCMLNQSSLPFGGFDLKTLFMGSISGDQIATLAMPVAGVAPSYWSW